ncbi:MAG: fibronectin type III domain-containing protein, partial [Candidatus Diapherotrites archaeon]|nr:fibronectin type III domain-containing protein [Candidatus Diapherotrites archaeon]
LETLLPSLVSKTAPAENKGTALSFNPDGTQTDGVWYFHLRACNSSSQCSSTSHFKAKIDKSGPTQPIELSLTANPNGTVDITWNASSERPEGENSGIKEYRIYRRLNDDTPDDSDVVGTVTTTSFTDNDTALNNGVRYYYWVRAFDNAGNSGTISGVRSILVTKTTSCAINFTSSIEQFIKTGEAKVKISSSTAMQDAELTAKILGGQTIQQQETDYQNTFVEATLNINQSFDERTLELTLSAQDSSGRECFYRKTLQIDGSAPEIEWTKPLDGTNIDMSLPLNISVTATDQKSGVEKVVFYFKQKGLTTKIGEDSEPTGSEYSVNFSPQGLKKGEIELLAEAFDGAGNKKETKISANVSKIPIEETVYDRTEYSFRLSELDSLLKQTGLKEELAIEAKNFLQNNSVSREFIVTQLEEEYFAKILVEFFNNSNEKLDIKIVEIVPKAFAQNAALISSEKNFEIILDDPVIEFTFLQVEPGEKIELEYSLKNPLTKQEADELIEKKPSEQFSSPPIILNSSTNTKDGFSTKGIPPSLILILLAVIIIAFIVFVALAAFGGGLILHLHKKANEAPLAREAKAIKRSPGPMEQASDQLKNWFAQKDIEEQKGKRFKWKGS